METTCLSNDQKYWYKTVGGLRQRRKDLFTFPMHKLLEIELYAVEYLYNGRQALSTCLEDINWSLSHYKRSRLYEYLYRYRKDIEIAVHYVKSDKPFIEVQPSEVAHKTIADWDSMSEYEKLKYS